MSILFIQGDNTFWSLFWAIIRSQELNLRKLYNVCHKSYRDLKFNEISLSFK
jgi:hypothetical protein